MSEIQGDMGAAHVSSGFGLDAEPVQFSLQGERLSFVEPYRFGIGREERR